ncbi:FimV/HubP family polar landmark protein [Massilia varians]|uniref:FimV/HubP family polar landmark protein n=1 Tax=Massilia varians TaxID=457921 RepID=UPI002491B04E|nr:FimV/HubP family polar landmark protein [Massilia varians]
MLLSSAASAAGLGKLTVLSALGQPLRAEIELTTTAGEDASSMAVKLASPEAFRAANIEFNPALLALRFNVEQRAGRQFIRVSSTQPLNEPFVDMLIELSWNNGRLVREYTFLLDPAELRNTQPAQAAAEARPAAPQPAAQPRAAAPQPAAPPSQAPQQAQPEPRREAPRAAAPAEAPASAAASRYRVRQGDTLGKIAAKLKPADISLDMMLVALYRANPDAFIGNNMNRLKSGQILSVPDSGALRGSGEAEARGIVVAHAADFNAYRNKLAGQVANAAPQRTPQAGQSAAGKITAKVEERPTAANESQDQLRLSKATQAAAGAQGAATASAEDSIARERELEQAQARVKELEKNVNELEQLMTVKSRSGSEVQNAAAAGAVAGAATPAAPAAKPAAAAKPAKPAAPAEPKPAEKGLADTLMDNINVVAGGAAILLLGALGISQRRRKKGDGAKGVVAEPSVLGVPTQGAHSLYAEAGGQSVDTSNSVFNSSFAPSASQLDTNEVDPVAEADVYIAYGRDAQAEEILKEALRTHPERHAVRLKLLEIYAARKDLRAFETQASELYSLTRGTGDEWAQAAALGLGIDPSNPLYAAAAGAAPVAPAPSPQERDQQSLLSQQLEASFRGGAPVAALGAGAMAGAAYAAMDHDQEQEATALPDFDATLPADASPVAEQRSDDNSLDFDLGGLSFEPIASTEPIAMAGPGRDDALDDTAVPDLDFALDPLGDPVTSPPPDLAAAPAPASEEPFDLAFDMSFGEPEAAVQPETAHAPVAQHDMAGLAAEFELPPLPAVDEDAAPAPAAQSAHEDRLFDLYTMDFGLPPAAAAPAAVAEATPFHEELPAVLGATAGASGTDDPLFDLDTMDFGSPAAPNAAPSLSQPALAPFEFDAPPAAASPAADEDPFALDDVPAATPAAAASEPSFDLADIDLELPSFEQPAAFDADFLAPSSEPALEPAALSPEHMEMETKLDLAIAYQEIGDKEGARELLDEVIKGGSSEQVSKASAMRSLLA